ncbi:hypothetical protein [Paenibacillus lutimineralis]|uniref:hypothetical protein n=1 Tax=Paenibacillus lutimineralis TaxID=2707005 RepID=UPI001D04F1E2|nr:hypothetical protein [Paenibacillus lutimineralis]
MYLPSIGLAATDGSTVDLAEGGLTVVYAYPRTSPAIGGALEGWDALPGFIQGFNQSGMPRM